MILRESSKALIFFSVLLLSQPAGDQKKTPDFETLQTENKELKTRIQSMKQDHRQIMDELRHATKHEAYVYYKTPCYRQGG